MTKKISDKDLEKIDGGMDEIVHPRDTPVDPADSTVEVEPKDVPSGSSGSGGGGTHVSDDDPIG